jgi:hypothetical protein
MKKKSLFYRLTLVLLLGALIMPAQTAQAQFGGFVHDVKNYVLQLKKRADDARFHAEKFDNAVKQLTTLRGVLGQAEDLVTDRFVSKATMRDIGLTVRASMQLKDQTRAIIQSRLTMLKSIDDRLKRGIFDPEADMRDLEDYLRTSIGRSSQDSLANLERLRAMDNILERMTEDLLKAHEELAYAQSERKKWELQLAIATSPDLPESKRDVAGINAIMRMIDKYDALIVEYNKKIEDLKLKIFLRKLKYQALMDERIKFGEEVDATTNGWEVLDGETEKFRRELR